MKTLPKNWMTEGLIDFEYKKYQLLAYLKETNNQFKDVKIYPALGDLISHHRVLDELNSGKIALHKLFPKNLESIDLHQAKLHYSSAVKTGELMEEVSKITTFALEKITHQIDHGKSIYDFVEDQLEFDPVGIIPIYNREGYILLSQERSSDIHAFRYKADLIQYAGEKFRSISLWLIGVFRRSLINTLEKIKVELAREVKELPNPATWRLHSKHAFPIEETLLPISKRLLLKTVTDQA
jgi:hypothetical protein